MQIVVEFGHRSRMSKAVAHEGAVSYGVEGACAMSSGPLQTMYACTQTGRLFSVWEARLTERTVTQEPAALRTFYCPVCPMSVLRLGADPVAKCGVCGWTSTSADDLGTFSDLMVRDAEPFPKIASAVHDTAMRWKALYDGTKRVGSEVDDMRGLSRATVQVTKGEEAFDSGMCIPNDTIVLAANVQRRDQLAPRRKLAEPVVEVISPFTGMVLKDGVIENPKMYDNAGSFLPRVTAAIVNHVCGSTEGRRGEIWLKLHNATSTDMRIQIENLTSVLLKATSKTIIKVGTRMKRVIHGEKGRCRFVASLLFEVKLEGDVEEISKYEWRYTVFVWHYWHSLKSEQNWHAHSP